MQTNILSCTVIKRNLVFNITPSYDLHTSIIDVAVVGSLCPRCFWKIHRLGNDTIYPELLSVGMVSWNKLAGCWQLKDKKNALLINSLLKGNGVEMIYIYIYIYTIYIWKLSSVWTSDFFSLLALKPSIFIEVSSGDNHFRLPNQSHSLPIFDWSAYQMRWSLYARRVSLPRIWF